MKAFSFKMLVISFMVGLGMFFGLDVAMKGLGKQNTPALESQVQQPIVASPGVTAATARQQQTKEAIKKSSLINETGKNQRQMETARQERLQQEAKSRQQVESTVVMEDSFVNRLSNRIGDLLRRTAAGCVHLIVSIFASILG